MGIIAVNQIGPILIESPLRISGTILIFSGITLFLFIYILLLLPETKVNISLAIASYIHGNLRTVFKPRR